ncbi:MAG TPA: OB-fold nucleic acid binding domain-containing protein, partial [Dehalococcoidia bacterium]|nr:OB-fold nucleic acid binding domain-containing protein [Dehalococcoidia bacterium]
LPPDVNHSSVNFTIEPSTDGQRAIRFGLGVVKNVGAGAAEAVIEARPEPGYTTVEEFCREAPLGTINKRAVESLIKAGALDALGQRSTLNANLERLFAVAQREQRLKETGQTTMFDLFGSQVDTPMPQLELEPVEAPVSEILAWEKELLGVYVSEHPFTRAAQQLAEHVTVLCAELRGETAGEYVVGGSLTSCNRRVTRDGRPFAVVELEDLSGSVELTVWSDVLEVTPDLWTAGQILLCLVRVRDRGDRVQFSVQKAVPYDLESEQLRGYEPSEWGVRRGARRPLPRAADPAPARAEAEPNSAPTAQASNAVAVEEGPGEPITPTVVETPREQVVEEPAANRDGQVDGVALRAVSPSTNGAGPGRAGLVITVHETSDEDADRERLHRIARALKKFPGDDEVSLVINQLSGGFVQVAFGKADGAADLGVELVGLTGVEITRK